MSQADLIEFQQVIFTDTPLQARLREIEDRDEFIAEVVEAGRERGFELTAQEVSDALQTGRRAWLERWLG